MKKHYAWVLASLLAMPAFSQTPYQAPADKDVAKFKPLHSMTGTEYVPSAPMANKPTGQVEVPTRAGFTEAIIGNTQYDLQSNGSVQNRMVQVNGELSAGWTQSYQVSPFSDRGTGYNYSDGDEWEAIPFDPIESVRVGWPSIGRTAGGREFAITHPGFTVLNMAYRDAGSGAWSEVDIDTEVPQGLLWPRATAGGADGNSIHLFALTTPIANQEAGSEMTWEGMDGALLYYRSLDQGDTWDIQDSLLAPMDATQFLGFDGDSYAIHARGDKIAFAVFNDWADSFVLISEDNGDTWTRRNLVDFPVDLFPADDELLDLDGDFVADTVLTTDNSGAVHIDQNMNTHVLWGNMRVLDDIQGDDQTNYFPFTDGLEYWNEGMMDNTSETIAVTTDIDGDGEVIFADDIGTYFTSLTALPNMGSDAMGNLYVSYSGVVETHATGTQNYRHVFLLKSEDGGTSWTVPVDATPDEEYIGYEAVFCTMAPDVDDRIEMIYQRDLEPGLHVRGDEDPVDLNDIMHLSVTTDLLIVGIAEQAVDWNMELFPNPAESKVTVMLPELPIADVRVLDLTGQEVLENKAVNGIVHFDVNALPAGVYLVEASNGVLAKTQRLIVR